MYIQNSLSKIWHYKDIFGCHLDYFKCFKRYYTIEYDKRKFEKFENTESCYGEYINIKDF